MFKKILIISGALCLIEIFQSSFLVLFFPTGATPNLLLITLIFFVAMNGLNGALVFVILSGVIVDIFSFSTIGLNVASFVAVSLLTGFFARRLSISQPFWKFFILIFLVGAGSYLNNFAINILQALSGWTFDGRMIFFSADLSKYILTNMGMATLLYWPLKKIVNSQIFLYENRSVVIR